LLKILISSVVPSVLHIFLGLVVDVLAKTLGIEKRAIRKQSFSSLSERTQRYKLSAAPKFMELIAGYMAPNEGKEFLRKACQKKFPDVFSKPS
jgi:hypothetical protein